MQLFSQKLYLYLYFEPLFIAFCDETIFITMTLDDCPDYVSYDLRSYTISVVFIMVLSLPFRANMELHQ